MANIKGRDPTFTINSFEEPLIYTADETIVRNILLILFGRPGFYPSIPYLGMHIQDYLYKLEDDMDTGKIKSMLATQCTDFLPYIQSGELDVYITHYNNNPWLVFVLPVIARTQNSQLVLGVTVLDNGEMQFNFIFNDDDVQEI